MSLRAMTWALKQEGLTPTRKLILVVLADHVDPDGVCYPSQGLVAERVGVSSRALRYNLDWLASNGFLEVEERRAHSNRFATNTYRLTFLRGKLASYGDEESPETPVGSGLPAEESEPSEAGFLRTVGNELPTEGVAPSEAGFLSRRKRASSGDSIVDFEPPSEPEETSGDGFRGRKPLPDVEVVCWVPITGKRPEALNRFAAPIRDSEDFGTEYGVMPAELAELEEAFPGVDVASKLRALRQWARNRPRRRKTYGGMPAWLSDRMAAAQDEGRRATAPSSPAVAGGLPSRRPKPATPEERAAMLEQWLRDADRRGWPVEVYREAVRLWFGCELEEVPDDKLRVLSLCTEERMPDFPLEGCVEEASRKLQEAASA